MENKNREYVGGLQPGEAGNMRPHVKADQDTADADRRDEECRDQSAPACMAKALGGDHRLSVSLSGEHADEQRKSGRKVGGEAASEQREPGIMLGSACRDTLPRPFRSGKKGAAGPSALLPADPVALQKVPCRFGAELCRRFDIFNCLSLVAKASMGHSTVKIESWVLGIDGDGSIIIMDGFHFPAKFPVCYSPVKIRLRIFRVISNFPVEVFDGTRVIAHVVVDGAPVAVGARQHGIDSDNFIEILDSPGIFAQSMQGIAAVAVDEPVIFRNLQGVIVQGDIVPPTADLQRRQGEDAQEVQRRRCGKPLADRLRFPRISGIPHAAMRKRPIDGIYV